MPILTKNSTEPNLQKSIEHEAFIALSGRTPRELESLLHKLLNSQEMSSLGKRVMMLKFFHQKIPQSQIAARLDISTTTVSQMHAKYKENLNLQRLARRLSGQPSQSDNFQVQ
jgi:DNA-directed RNA polymerase specialized sigma subunit